MINKRNRGTHQLLERRAFLAGGLAAPFSVAACSSPRPAASLATTTLRVASSKVADDLFFERAGVGNTPYRIERVRLSQASTAAEALLAGAYDLNIQSNIAPVFFGPSAPVRLAGFVPYAPAPFKIYARGGAGLTSVEQMRGRKVGYMRGGPLHFLLIAILKQHGLSLGDIQPIALSATDSVAAFTRGDLDFVLAGLIAPLWRIEEAGGREIGNGSDYPEFSHNIGNTLAVNAAVLSDPFMLAAVADYISRLETTWRWIDDHLDEWSRAVAADYQTPPEVAARYRTRPRGATFSNNADGLLRTTAVARAFERAGVISTPPNLASLFDPTAEVALGRLATA
jgi:sulfonate transport system substrate-binding protein